MAENRASGLETLQKAGLKVAELAQPDHSVLYRITGNTHPHRHGLRAAGGSWNKVKQCWEFTCPPDADSPLARIATTLTDGGDGHNPPGLSEGGSVAISGGAEKPHYHGHRGRLRERFMESAEGGLPDYELLELLLFFSIPRIDVKPLAKDLLSRFGGLSSVLAADPERLAEFEQVTHQTIVHFRALREAALRLARDKASEGPVLDSWDSLIEYCRAAMAHSAIEEFRLFFLDRKNRLIADEVQ